MLGMLFCPPMAPWRPFESILSFYQPGAPASTDADESPFSTAAAGSVTPDSLADGRSRRAEGAMKWEKAMVRGLGQVLAEGGAAGARPWNQRFPTSCLPRMNPLAGRGEPALLRRIANACPDRRMDASSAGKRQAVFAIGKGRDISDELHSAHFLAGVIADGRRLAAFPLHIMAAGNRWRLPVLLIRVLFASGCRAASTCEQYQEVATRMEDCEQLG